MYSPYGAALLEHHHHHHHFAMGGPIPPFLHSLMTTPPLQGHHRGFGPQHMLHHHHHHHHLSVHSTAAAFPSAAAFSTPIARQRTPSGNTLTPGRTVATAWMPASGNSASAMPPPGTKTSGGIAANSGLSSAQTNGELAAQQHPGTGAAPTTTSVSAERVNPLSGKTLERDLSHASKEELIQVLLDLSSCNYDASGFIHTKAQLFCLRSAVATKSCGAFATAAGSEVPRHVGHHTPSKSLFASQLTEGATPDSSCYSAAGAAATTGTRSAANTAPNSTSKDTTIQSQPRRAMASGSPTTATSNSCGAAGAGNGSPYASSPIRELQQSLHDRHITPETRPFSSELHPCARLFGACRHSTNCVFRNLPNNLCLHWVRGCCSSGTECNYVHRLPNPCPSTVQAVFDLAHGQDRNHAAALRAAQEQQHQQHVTLPPPPAMTTPAKHTPSVAELSFSAYGGGLSTPTRDDQRTSRQLIMSESEGVPEEGGAQHDSGELVPAADPETYHPSSVARTLDDSFERAAS